MKRRQGFVSNSSSSSFICSVCGDIEELENGGLNAYGWFECKSGHISHVNCAKSAGIEGLAISDQVDEDGYDALVPIKYCPVCQFKTFLTQDIISWLAKEHGIIWKSLGEEIKARYKNYAAFKKALVE